MLDQQDEEIFQFLAGNWYSRPEDDHEIVEEILHDIPPAEVQRAVDLIRDFLAGPKSGTEKSAFIRKSVQRYIPEGVEAPVDWLQGVLQHLDQSLKRRTIR